MSYIGETTTNSKVASFTTDADVFTTATTFITINNWNEDFSSSLCTYTSSSGVFTINEKGDYKIDSLLSFNANVDFRFGVEVEYTKNTSITEWAIKGGYIRQNSGARETQTRLSRISSLEKGDTIQLRVRRTTSATDSNTLRALSGQCNLAFIKLEAG